MKVKIITLALAALTAGILGSCKKDTAPSTVSVTGVKLDKTELTMTVGDETLKIGVGVTPTR